MHAPQREGGAMGVDPREISTLFEVQLLHDVANLGNGFLLVVLPSQEYLSTLHRELVVVQFIVKMRVQK